MSKVSAREAQQKQFNIAINQFIIIDFTCEYYHNTADMLHKPTCGYTEVVVKYMPVYVCHICVSKILSSPEIYV
jgi:hypothetical protein